MYSNACVRIVAFLIGMSVLASGVEAQTLLMAAGGGGGGGGGTFIYEAPEPASLELLFLALPLALLRRRVSRTWR